MKKPLVWFLGFVLLATACVLAGALVLTTERGRDRISAKGWAPIPSREVNPGYHEVRASAEPAGAATSMDPYSDFHDFVTKSRAGLDPGRITEFIRTLRERRVPVNVLISLYSSSESGDLRRLLLELICEGADPCIEDFLLGVLAIEDFRRCIKVIRKLGQIGSKKAVGRFREIFAGLDMGTDIHRTFMRVIVEALECIDDDESRGLLLDILARNDLDKGSALMESAVLGLGRIARGDSVEWLVERWNEPCDDGPWTTCLLYARALGRNADASLLSNTFARIMHAETDPTRRNYFLSGFLSEAPTDFSLPVLKRMMNDGSNAEKLQAGMLLQEMSDGRAAGLLIASFSREPDRIARWNIASSLSASRSSSEESHESLAEKFLCEKDMDIRLFLGAHLSRYSRQNGARDDVVRELRRAAEAHCPSQEYATGEGVEAIRAEKSIEILVNLFRVGAESDLKIAQVLSWTWKRRQDRLLSSALAGLRQCRLGAELAQLVLTIARDRGLDDFTRILAVLCLEQSCDENVVKACLEIAVFEEDDDLASACLDLLAACGGKEAAEHLKARLDQAREPGRKRMIEQTIRRIEGGD